MSEVTQLTDEEGEMSRTSGGPGGGQPFAEVASKPLPLKLNTGPQTLAPRLEEVT